MANSAIGAPERHSRLRSIVAATLGIAMIAMTMIVSLPAMAAGSWVRGMPIPGGTGWLGTWIPYQGQTVKVKPSTPGLPVTGSNAALFGATSLVLLGVGATVLGVRRRQLV